jgi:lysozyme
MAAKEGLTYDWERDSILCWELAIAELRNGSVKHMNLDSLVLELEKEEGYVPHAYQDTEGFWTIGIGTLVDPRKNAGLTKEEARYLCRNRASIAAAALIAALPWVHRLSERRQHALCQMVFQLGLSGFLKFEKMLEALKAEKWDLAAAEALSSRWAAQTPNRAKRIALALKEG